MRVCDFFFGYTVRLQPLGTRWAVRIHDEHGICVFACSYAQGLSAILAAHEWLGLLGNRSEIDAANLNDTRQDIADLLTQMMAEQRSTGDLLMTSRASLLDA